ncbi:hypothetical protein PO909_011127 [Leuciscus waleckii]
MRWVCDCVVTLQYRAVGGAFLNGELGKLQCNRIGPVIDMTVISGKLEEVHLPHYACLGESDPSLKDAVKVLTVEDEGITTEPVQLTRFHAKIVQPSSSIATVIVSRIKRLYEHCDLLLYMRSKDPLILFIYFFPYDDYEKEKVEKTEKSNEPIKHPKPDRPFRMKTPHFLTIPGALIHPNEGISFRRETPPNFFKVNTRLKNDLQVTLLREEDGVKNGQIIADKLCQQKLIHEEQHLEITQSYTSMRKICDIIRKHRDAVKAEFISVLHLGSSGFTTSGPALTVLSVLSLFNVSLFVLCLITWLCLCLCWSCAPLAPPPCFLLPRPLV